MGSSVEARIISRLGKLVDVLAAKQPILKEFTCRTVILDLRTAPYNAKRVKATRGLLRASQMIFSKFLGVSVATVRGWEQGTVLPSKMACRFLDEIHRNPDFWRGRLSESVRVKREMA